MSAPAEAAGRGADRGADRAAEEAARAAMAAVFAEAGGREVDPDFVQPAGPYLDLSGEAVRARIVTLEPAGADAYCLRPDLTIPVARLHLSEAPETPARYRYDAWVFRFADADGRVPAQHRELGVESFGAADPVAEDAQIAGLAVRALEAVGARVAGLALGDAALFAAFVDLLGLADADAARIKRAFARPKAFAAMLERVARPSPLAAALAGVRQDEAAAALEEIYALAGVEPVGGRPPAAIAERLLEEAAEARAARLSPAAIDLVSRFAALEDTPERAFDAIEALAREAAGAGGALDAARADWTRRLDALAAQGVSLEGARLSVRLASAFAYYDGFVFEARDPELGPAARLAAGGRYDGLLPRLGAADAQPAVGCMARPARAAASARAAGRTA